MQRRLFTSERKGFVTRNVGSVNKKGGGKAKSRKPSSLRSTRRPRLANGGCCYCRFGDAQGQAYQGGPGLKKGRFCGARVCNSCIYSFDQACQSYWDNLEKKGDGYTNGGV